MREPPATPEISDAKRRLAAVEDQRDDEVLLVAEVAVEPPEKLVAIPGVSVAGAANEIEVGRSGAEEGVRRLDHGNDGRMDLFVIALEHLEAADEPRLGRAEQREELMSSI